MSDLARRFRDAREASAFSLTDAERATRIKRRFLEAIEAGDFAQLPDGLPSRGFVRLYARFLGLDEDQALAEFDAETGGAAVLPIEPVPSQPERRPMQSKFTRPQVAPARATVTWKGALPPAADADLPAEGFARTRRSLAELDEEEDTAMVPERNGSRPSQAAGSAQARTSFSLRPTPVIEDVNFARANVARAKATRGARSQGPRPQVALPRALRDVRLWTGVAAVALVAVLAWLVVSVIAPAVRSATAAAAPPVATQAARPTVELQATAAPVAVPGVQPTRPPTQPPAATGAAVQVALDALERAWVRVRVDGAVVFEGIPPPGPTAAWQARQSIGVETGNAGAFEAVVNGQRVGRLGDRNAALKRTWDANGGVKDETP